MAGYEVPDDLTSAAHGMWQAFRNGSAYDLRIVDGAEESVAPSVWGVGASCEPGCRLLPHRSVPVLPGNSRLTRRSPGGLRHQKPGLPPAGARRRHRRQPHDCPPQLPAEWLNAHRPDLFLESDRLINDKGKRIALRYTRRPYGPSLFTALGWRGVDLGKES